MISTRISIRTKKRRVVVVTGSDAEEAEEVTYVHLTSADLSPAPVEEVEYEEEETEEYRSRRSAFGFAPRI